MKKITLLLLAALLSFMLPCGAYAQIEKGNPVSRIDGYWEAGSIPLFINGTLVEDCNVITIGGGLYVPVRLVGEELGASVVWDSEKQEVTLKKDEDTFVLYVDKNIGISLSVNGKTHGKETGMYAKAVLRDGSVFVPVSFFDKRLGAVVSYFNPSISSARNSLTYNSASVYIDEELDGDVISKDDALDKVKSLCRQGLENFKAHRTALAEDFATEHKRDFDFIAECIDGMTYLGEVSRYYKFDMQVYEVLYDKLNGNMFFIIRNDATSIVKFDIDSPNLYIPLFFVG